VLGPGALVITALAPVGAQLVQRKIVHPRYLIMFSFSVVAAALWHYSTFPLETDYRHYVLARAFQAWDTGSFSYRRTSSRTRNCGRIRTIGRRA